MSHVRFTFVARVAASSERLQPTTVHNGFPCFHFLIIPIPPSRHGPWKFEGGQIAQSLICYY